MAARAARVLVVDDDPYTRDILDRFLTERGFEVESANDGEEALRSIESYEPDIVLLDIRMPRMDGIECLAHIVDDELECGVISPAKPSRAAPPTSSSSPSTSATWKRA